jgi:hypothetical protein
VVLDFVAHHFRIANHGLETRAGEHAFFSPFDVMVVGVQHDTKAPERPAHPRQLPQPLAVHAVTGAIDVTTGNAFMRLHQVERSFSQFMADGTRERPVAPQPSEIERIAGDDLEAFAAAPLAGDQGERHVTGAEGFESARHETLGAAILRVALADEGNGDRLRHGDINRFIAGKVAVASGYSACDNTREK